MNVRPSRRLASLPGYPFAEIDRQVARLRDEGHDPVDFGVGDPTEPTPEVVRRAIQEAVDRRAAEGYPSYVGAPEFRQEIAAWYRRRFGVSLDPDREVSSNVGAKEAVFHFPLCLIDPGDVVLCPTPGYPPYHRGTLFAGGVPWFYPLRPEGGFLPDLDAIPDAVAARARLIWVNYPNSPAGRVPPDDFWPRLVRWASDRGIVVASDEAYSEVWFDRPPRSILEFAREGVVVFQSLSKRSNMTGHRVGWVCGDPEVVGLFQRLKTNIDSGTPTFIQDGAIAALRDESHVDRMREIYRGKRDRLVGALRDIGCQVNPPEATLYLWPRVPQGMTGLDFARRLLDPSVAVVCTPGLALGEPSDDGGPHPGEHHVRFALVPSLDRVEEAVNRLRRVSF